MRLSSVGHCRALGSRCRSPRSVAISACTGILLVCRRIAQYCGPWRAHSRLAPRLLMRCCCCAHSHGTAIRGVGACTLACIISLLPASSAFGHCAPFRSFAQCASCSPTACKCTGCNTHSPPLEPSIVFPDSALKFARVYKAFSVALPVDRTTSQLTAPFISQLCSRSRCLIRSRLTTT